jgi:hypothetical protein
MSHPSRLALALASVLAACPLSPCAGARAESPPGPSRGRFFAELSAGPLLGIDRPLRGCSAELLAGVALAPFEAGLGAACAYDAGLGAGSLRLGLELGLGGGLRAIVGGLLLFGEPALRDPGGGEARLAATAADWPNRFGIAAEMAALPWRPLGARLVLEAEMDYVAYRLRSGSALAGAAAFAACVEARLALRSRWEPGGRP